MKKIQAKLVGAMLLAFKDVGKELRRSDIILSARKAL